MRSPDVFLLLLRVRTASHPIFKPHSLALCRMCMKALCDTRSHCQSAQSLQDAGCLFV
jgi:hypothetical protein